MLWPRRIWWVVGEPLAIPAPAGCPGCGAGGGDLAATPSEPPLDAANARAVSDGAASDAAQPDGAQLSAAQPDASASGAAVPEAAPARWKGTSDYCSTCQREHERQREASLLGATLALLSGCACALLLPVLRPAAGLGAQLALAALACALPIAGLGSSRRIGLWGSAPRSWPQGRAGVVLERRALADDWARAGLRCQALWLPPLLYRRGLVALVPCVVLVFAAIAHAWHHPRLWLLALGPEPLTVLVDGVPVARLPAARPGADDALVLRVASGVRHLVARDDAGTIVTDALAELRRGAEHVFAAGGSDECFWLERTGYGQDTTRDSSPLAAGSRFFSLSSDVDGWLSAGNLPPAATDRRFTGGTLTVLRHAPCRRASELMRAASATGP